MSGFAAASLVRSNSRLVVLDVVVTDKSGKPIRNSTQDHFGGLETECRKNRRSNRLEQLDRFPGWKLHPLKGDLKGFWSLTVTGNWRLIFRYEEDTDSASDIDLIDYH